MSEERSPFLPEEDATGAEERAPWSFRLAVVAAAVYLLYRLGQGVVWLVEWVAGR